MGVDSFLALVMRVAAGIMAIQAPGRAVAPEDALSWAAAATYHATRSDLDPFELIGIARNETDFRPDLVGPDGKDCGLTQTRVTYSRYRCRELRKDPWLSFEEAARELRENRARCLKRARWDLERCRVNSYNSGVRYAKRGRAGAYWLRVKCFTEAAREGVRPVADCRKVTSRGAIARLIAASKNAQTEVASAGPRTR
jgi:hypothetical protein